MEARAGDGVEIAQVKRRYRPGSLVLETEFTTGSGVVRVTDAMAIDSPTPTVARVVEGLRGEVPMRSELIIRFDYGWIVPWVIQPRVGYLGDRRARQAAAPVVGRAPR